MPMAKCEVRSTAANNKGAGNLCGFGLALGLKVRHHSKVKAQKAKPGAQYTSLLTQNIIGCSSPGELRILCLEPGLSAGHEAMPVLHRKALTQRGVARAAFFKLRREHRLPARELLLSVRGRQLGPVAQDEDGEADEEGVE